MKIGNKDNIASLIEMLEEIRDLENMYEDNTAAIDDLTPEEFAEFDPSDDFIAREEISDLWNSFYNKVENIKNGI